MEMWLDDKLTKVLEDSKRDDAAADFNDVIMQLYKKPPPGLNYAIFIVILTTLILRPVARILFFTPLASKHL